jgi:signal transduction histidine kinase
MALVTASIVLFTIGLGSFFSNVMINASFEDYIKEKHESQADTLAIDLSHQYNALTGRWDSSYVHGVGMHALYEGYIIKLYDGKGNPVWDAENHDMTLCSQIMAQVSERMTASRPKLPGGIITHEKDLVQDNQTVGKLLVSYYGPYFFSESDLRFLDALNAAMLAAGLVSIVAGSLAGGFLAGRISKPITKSAHIATHISEGNYNIRFNGKARTKELSELVAAINNMAESLSRQDSLRRRLTTDVAHELRTPLTVVASHLEAMIEGVWSASQERLQSVYEEIERLSGLVSDLERLSKVEKDIRELSKTPVDLLELAQNVKESFDLESSKKGITVNTSGSSAIVLADGPRMRQVISNLLSNAIKYTSEGGKISIQVKDGVSWATVTVKDNGIGISEEELPLVFERFYRTDKSRSRKTGGAGIGLAIAKSLVTAHDGDITATSKPDLGSSFVVRLPKGMPEDLD